MTARELQDPWYVEALRTWNQVLDTQCELHADRTLFEFGEAEISYGEFRREVERFAKGLIHLGVKQNDVVGIWMTNSIDWAICQFAVYKTGAILLPLYSYYRETELSYALEQAGVRTLIMTDSFLGKIDALAIARQVIPEVDVSAGSKFASAGFPALREIIRVRPQFQLASCHDFEAVCADGETGVSDLDLLKRQSAISPFDVMNIMYTSGTTGFPKGGMSMHVTNLVTTLQWSAMAGLGDQDVILCHVPLFTNFGGLYGTALGILNGCRVVITEQFDAGQSLRLIEEKGVTYVPGTPSMFRMMLDHPDVSKRNLSKLRGGHVAGAPLTETTMHEILQVLGATDIMQAWGLSECGGLSTVSTKDHPMEKRLRSVGKPLASSIVRIMDPDTLAELEPGTQGEIVLGDRHPGSCVGSGYYNMPEKTAERITEKGLFRTGDVGYFDDEGFLHITGRVDDMFTVGGFNIYPAEIENALEKLEGIAEAHIVPVADRRLGNVPAAWVRREKGASIEPAEIVEYCRRAMTSQKSPRRVFFYEAGELPLTPAGKLKKKELAEQTGTLVANDPEAGLVKQPERSK